MSKCKINTAVNVEMHWRRDIEKREKELEKEKEQFFNFSQKVWNAVCKTSHKQEE